MKKKARTAGNDSRIMGPWGKRVYLLSLVLLVFTGFGQLPIFKRYYISSIPGMGWSADFSTTLLIHYLAGIVFVFLCVYYLIVFLKQRTAETGVLNRSALKGLLLALILASGFLLAVRNMSEANLSPMVSFVTVWMHFIATMVFLVSAAAFLFLRKSAPAPVRAHAKQ